MFSFRSGTVLAVAITFAALTVVHGTEPASLPKDTLPTKLSFDSIPLGLDRQRPIPKDNPLTEAKIQLGRKLFFDPILSADGKVACASCHQPSHGFASPERFPTG